MPLIEPTYSCDLSGCSNTFKLSDSYSISPAFAMTGNTAIAAFMCPSGQHFCCSEEHARQQAHYCIDSHLIPFFDTEKNKMVTPVPGADQATIAGGLASGGGAN